MVALAEAPVTPATVPIIVKKLFIKIVYYNNFTFYIYFRLKDIGTNKISQF